MRVSPIEIRQKTFEKKFRGFDPEEVETFLVSLSQEWERTLSENRELISKSLDENKELRLRLENSEREVQKLREVETSLFKTLKTAEDTSANMIEQANRSADLLMRETQIKVESMMNDARSHAKDLLEEADESAKNLVYDAQGDLKDLQHQYWELENHRDKILQELKNIAGDISDKVLKFNEKQEDLKKIKSERTATREAKPAKKAEDFIREVINTPSPSSDHDFKKENAPVAADTNSVTSRFFEEVKETPVDKIEFEISLPEEVEIVETVAPAPLVEIEQIVEAEVENTFPIAEVTPQITPAAEVGKTEEPVQEPVKEQEKLPLFQQEAPKLNSQATGSFFDQIV